MADQLGGDVRFGSRRSSRGYAPEVVEDVFARRGLGSHECALPPSQDVFVCEAVPEYAEGGCGRQTSKRSQQVTIFRGRRSLSE